MITKADLVRLATHDHQQMYRETGNPIHVWCAYVQARKLNAIPGWIVEYFDAAAALLLAQGGTESPQVIAKNLGLFTKRGGPSARERAVTKKRELAIRQRYAVELARGISGVKARKKMEDTIGLGESSVRAIVYKKPHK